MNGHFSILAVVEVKKGHLRQGVYVIFKGEIRIKAHIKVTFSGGRLNNSAIRDQIKTAIERGY